DRDRDEARRLLHGDGGAGGRHAVEDGVILCQSHDQPVRAVGSDECGGDGDAEGRSGQGGAEPALRISPDVGVGGDPVYVDLNVALAADVGLPDVPGVEDDAPNVQL